MATKGGHPYVRAAGVALMAIGGAVAWMSSDDAGTADQTAEKDLAPTIPITVTCATCAANPCAYLACGLPGSQYRGGAHGCLRDPSTKSGPGRSIHSHHMPANAVSPLGDATPAIHMDYADHVSSASFGSKVFGPGYAIQRSLASQGRVFEAFMLDAGNASAIAAATGQAGKYDGAIAQATAYASCLKTHGIIR